MLPKTLQSAPRVLQGARFDVHRYSVPGRAGQTVQREVIAHPGAVAVLPLIDDDHVVLIRNQRPTIDQTLWEIPAGTLEPGEDPAVCAARELVEETGYEAARMEPLTGFYTTPGFCTEFMHAFVARQLRHVGQDLDDNERIEPRIVPMTQVLDMIRQRQLVDGKSIATILFFLMITRGS
jgi:ADP-ribose pyrophosphatase